MGKTKQVARKQLHQDSGDVLVEMITKGIQEKKGKEIVIMDLKSTGSGIADFFVICHADSTTQVDAIANSVEDEVFKNLGEKAIYKEGYTNSEWILLDYINVVVHIFLKEQRDFYGIEKFWADAETKRIA